MTPSEAFYTNSLSGQNITHPETSNKKGLGFLIREAWQYRVRHPTPTYPWLTTQDCHPYTAFLFLTSTAKWEWGLSLKLISIGRMFASCRHNWLGGLVP